VKATAASRRGVRTGNEDNGSVRTVMKTTAASGRGVTTVCLQDDAVSGRSVMTVRL
jgi:hypothetical protein